jgi:hypothetical protein
MGNRGLGRRDSCFGCIGIHPWVQNGMVVCPNANKPGVQEAAQAAYKKWLDKNRSHRGNRKRNRDTVDYDKLSDANKAKVREAVLASMAKETSSSTSSVSPAAKGNKKPKILMIDIVVLSAATASRSILPAPIVSNFPHIHLQLGTDLDCPNCSIVQCVVDTAVALSTGNFHFVAAVAKCYPHCIAKIYVPKDYNPIVLSGIVQRGGDSLTTELTVGFQFHLPYLTKESNPTSILIATGPQVTVNMIVGLPFIQATRAVKDLSDNVAELLALDAPPPPPLNTVAQRCMFQLPLGGARSSRFTWPMHTLT